jgi:hypothetical protein
LRKTALAIVVIVVAVAGGACWWALRSRLSGPPRGTAYSPSGYGGYVPAKQPRARPENSANARWGPELRPALEAYNASKWIDAEAAAERVAKQAAGKPGKEARRQSARAMHVLAYSAARRHDLKLARERFAAMREEAATIPDRGKERAEIGQVAPTLEAEAAYQHAVCTAALGDQAKAEREYLDFIRAYPESPLVHGAILRIGRFHHGDVPKAAEAVWRQAMTEARKQEKTRQPDLSRCAPECLAELLRRRGEHPNVKALAREMGTNEMGTSLAALARATKKRRMPARGLMVTAAGLRKVPLPCIVLLAPGHFVLLDQIGDAGAQVWDPSAGGIGKPGIAQIKVDAWRRRFQGVVLAVR